MFRPGMGRGYGQRGRQRGGANPMVLLMAAQLVQQIMAIRHKPPVTLGLMAFQTALFFRVIPDMPYWLSGAPHEVCLQPVAIVEGGQWSRALGSAFVHGDDWHLYLNMASLLWKGVQLEAAFGSPTFGLLTAALLALTQAIYIGAAYLMAAGGMDGGALWMSCAVGFSGVLFALKTILNVMAPSTQMIMGMTVPSKYAAWLELVLIHVMVPNASFAGHLSGILAGLVFLGLRYRAPWLLPAALRVSRIPSLTEAAGTTNIGPAAGMGMRGMGMGMGMGGMGMGRRGFGPGMYGGGAPGMGAGGYGAGMGMGGGGGVGGGPGGAQGYSSQAPSYRDDDGWTRANPRPNFHGTGTTGGGGGGDGGGGDSGGGDKAARAAHPDDNTSTNASTNTGTSTGTGTTSSSSGTNSGSGATTPTGSSTRRRAVRPEREDADDMYARRLAAAEARAARQRRGLH